MPIKVNIWSYLVDRQQVNIAVFVDLSVQVAVENHQLSFD